MNEDIFWKILDEILTFGEFIVAVPNSGASANLVSKISVGKDGAERVIEKSVCRCHVHIKPDKIASFSFTFVDAGYGEEPCCELLSPQNEVVLRLYLRGNKKFASEKFAGFSHKNSEFVKGFWG